MVKSSLTEWNFKRWTTSCLSWKSSGFFSLISEAEITPIITSLVHACHNWTASTCILRSEWQTLIRSQLAISFPQYIGYRASGSFIKYPGTLQPCFGVLLLMLNWNNVVPSTWFHFLVITVLRSLKHNLYLALLICSRSDSILPPIII